MPAAPEVLQGGCDVENSPPPERAATVGSYNGRSSVCDGIGVDGEWEYQRIRQSA